MDSERNGALDTLGRIRDNVLLLSLANAFLCDAPFLRRIGRDIDSMVVQIREDILTLKKQFPGKFATDVETEGFLEELHRKAQWMQNPDNETTEKCLAGDLGRGLEADVSALSLAIYAIRDQVQGKSPAYSKKDSVSLLVSRGTFFVSDFIRKVVKGLTLLILAVALSFGYLFFTMEKEEDFVTAINKSQAHVQSQLKILSSVDYERHQISRRIDSMSGRDQRRQAKIEMMELNEQIIKLDEKRRQAEVEIAAHESKIKENEAKVKEMRGKSFVKRLLRQ